jgi:hypothetical protein
MDIKGKHDDDSPFYFRVLVRYPSYRAIFGEAGKCLPEVVEGHSFFMAVCWETQQTLMAVGFRLRYL